MPKESVRSGGDHAAVRRIRARVEASRAEGQPRPEHERSGEDLNGDGHGAVGEKSVPRKQREDRDDEQGRCRER
jgi:hypothetical protein